MLFQVARQVHEHDPRIEPPLALDPMERVVVATRNDGLEGKDVGLLNHRKVAPRRGSIGALLHLDDGIGREMPGARSPVGVEPCGRAVHREHRLLALGGGLWGGVGSRLDSPMGEEARHSGEIPRIDEFRIAVEQVFDLACTVGHI